MTDTLYASFVNIEDAERAIGALIDHGVKPKDISMVGGEAHAGRLESYSTSKDLDLKKIEDHAKTGITTTTMEDAESGAAKGAGVGLGVGVAAALASMFIPGIGLVVGGGALALAIGGAAGATGAGAISGGTMGYLKDQGVNDEMVGTYTKTLNSGGVVLAVDITGEVPASEVQSICAKYSARNLTTRNSGVLH